MIWIDGPGLKQEKQTLLCCFECMAPFLPYLCELKWMACHGVQESCVFVLSTSAESSALHPGQGLHKPTFTLPL